MVASIAGSFKNQPVDPDTVVIGEVGLTGEIRPVNQAEKRIIERGKWLGFKRCLVPSGNKNSSITSTSRIELLYAGKVEEALGFLF